MKEFDLLTEGKLDLMYLPSGAIAWLWKDGRPEAQVQTAANIGRIAHQVNPISRAALLRSDQNVLVLHTSNGLKFTVYPDGGIGYDGKPIDIVAVEGLLNDLPTSDYNAIQNDMDDELFQNAANGIGAVQTQTIDDFGGFEDSGMDNYDVGPNHFDNLEDELLGTQKGVRITDLDF